MVIELKQVEKDSYTWDCLFTDIYTCLHGELEAIVYYYERQLNGDVHSAYSEATLLLIRCIDNFEYKGFEFLSFYKKALHNKMIDEIRKINADKRKHNTSYEVSLSASLTDNEGNSYSLVDRGIDASLQAIDTYKEDDVIRLTTILDKYRCIKPIDTEVIEIMLKYSAEGYQKKDLTSALAEFYGSEKYTSTIQKRVSRVRENFKKFAIEYGYAFHF